MVVSGFDSSLAGSVSDDDASDGAAEGDAVSGTVRISVCVAMSVPDAGGGLFPDAHPPETRQIMESRHNASLAARRIAPACSRPEPGARLLFI